MKPIFAEIIYRRSVRRRLERVQMLLKQLSKIRENIHIRDESSKGLNVLVKCNSSVCLLINM